MYRTTVFSLQGKIEDESRISRSNRQHAQSEIKAHDYDAENHELRE